MMEPLRAAGLAKVNFGFSLGLGSYDSAVFIFRIWIMHCHSMGFFCGV